MSELIQQEYDEEIAKDIIKNTKKEQRNLEKLELETLLSGKYDSNNAIITTKFDNVKFRVIIPSAPMTAGRLVHCYRTYIGQIETELGTSAYERNETI